MEAYNERAPSFSMVSPKPLVQHRHSSATLLDFAPLRDASGTSTPPLHIPGSVPFKWEQEPGKPRPGNRIGPKPARCLDPPPCRIRFVPYVDSGVPKMPSPHPGSILESGPPKFASCRFVGNPGLAGKKGRGRGLFGKLKGGGKREVYCGGEGNSGNSFSSNSSCESDESSGSGRKMRRHNSFSNLSQHHHRSPHIWATIYGGIKHAVHWKSVRK